MEADDFRKVRRALCAGFFENVLIFSQQQGAYQRLNGGGGGNEVVHIHPSSVLFSLKKKPPLAMYSALIYSSKLYARDLCGVQEEWLVEAAPAMYSGE